MRAAKLEKQEGSVCLQDDCLQLYLHTTILHTVYYTHDNIAHDLLHTARYTHDIIIYSTPVKNFSYINIYKYTYINIYKYL